MSSDEKEKLVPDEETGGYGGIGSGEAPAPPNSPAIVGSEGPPPPPGAVSSRSVFTGVMPEHLSLLPDAAPSPAGGMGGGLGGGG
eukprot:CAMPEP_0113578794 /NCGR_PEP_ID=MMETSP0015_2-20120614/29698_1 /TAXON_ID=2838 /ORGANISM="Odontella" /LENGTH=84 /DNA_ID=CAMNT_0000482677 /DNA_START=222 /DNA_END=472 /DNA_ORIENTATION=+ /assembly_acc=CAM_ASM_000160